MRRRPDFGLTNSHLTNRADYAPNRFSYPYLRTVILLFRIYEKSELLHDRKCVRIFCLYQRHYILMLTPRGTVLWAFWHFGKSTKTTLDTYSPVFAESEVKAMQAIDMALFRKAE